MAARVRLCVSRGVIEGTCHLVDDGGPVSGSDGYTLQANPKTLEGAQSGAGRAISLYE